MSAWLEEWLLVFLFIIVSQKHLELNVELNAPKATSTPLVTL